MKVAIFGAGGFIGRHLSLALQAAGADVVGWSSAQCFDPSGLLTDRLPVDADVRSVVYLSQSPHYRELPSSAAHVWSVNVTSAVRAAQWANRCGAGRFTYASSGTVYQPGFHPHREDEPVRRDDWYALSKVHAEESLALVAPDLELTCVRLFTVFGPTQVAKLVPNVIASVRERRPIRLEPNPSDSTDRDGLRLSLVYLDDVVRVLAALALTGGPRILNLASAEVRSIRAIAEAVARRIDRVPVFEMASTPRAGDVIADTARLVALCGEPFTRFDEGLDRVLTTVPSNQ